MLARGPCSLARTAQRLRWGIAALLVGFLSATAHADGNWHIADFAIHMAWKVDGTVAVTETITANFHEPKHGIFRTIPLRYQVGMHQYALRFRLVGVTDPAGGRYITQTKFEDNYVNIRIGNPDRKISGTNVYRIRYEIQRAVLFEGDHAALRWNATGHEWRVPILQSRVTVELPKPLDEEQVQYDAWTGRLGAHGKDSESKRDGQTITFTTGQLSPGEGVTVSISVPSDAVERPSFARQLGFWLTDNFVYGIALMTIAMCAMSWYARGRDRPGRGSVVVHYEPPAGLRPSQVGTLSDERVDMRDISATIIDFAVRGFIEIRELTPGGLLSSADYEITKVKEPVDLKPYERTLFTKLFEKGSTVRLSDLKHNFYTVLGTVKGDLYKDLAEQGYFDGRPDLVRTGFLAAGLALVAAAIGVALLIQYAMLDRVFVAPAIVTGIFSAAAVIVTSRVMPRKTRKGREAWEKIAGLEEFISRSEIESIEQQERRGVFERLLPFAVALDLTDRLAKAFQGIYTEPPQWFQSSHPGVFDTHVFVSSINRSVNSANAVLPSQPRTESSGSGGGWSSGGFSGGSSGGGFGGGGGGSW